MNARTKTGVGVVLALSAAAVAAEHNHEHSVLLTLGAQSHGTIGTGEADHWRFDLDGNATVEIRSGGSDADTVGTLFDAHGEPIVEDDDGGTGLNFRIVADLSSGPHYVRVESAAFGGNYGIIARLVRDDDHGDTPGASSRLVAGVRSAGRIDPAGDVDVFRIDVAETAVATVGTSGPGDTSGTLVDSEGDTVATSDRGGHGGNFAMTETLESGVYYLSVSAQDRSPYSVVFTVPGARVVEPPPVTIETMLGTWVGKDREGPPESWRLTRLVDGGELGTLAVEDHFRRDPAVVEEKGGIWIGALLGADLPPPPEEVGEIDYSLLYLGSETCAVYLYAMVSDTESGPVFGVRGTLDPFGDCEFEERLVETRFYRPWPHGGGDVPVEDASATGLAALMRHAQSMLP